MRIRQFQSKDAEGTANLYLDTVKRINSRDYSTEQIRAWISNDMDIDLWRFRLQKGLTYIADSEEGELLGFISIDHDGHIDLIYCHADHQGQGIGSKLLKYVERQLKASGITCFFTEASITARPFFEKQGFKVIKEQRVQKNDVSLINYIMEKRC
ncbi:MAG: GNAT family N-acetyltransferase [Smithella sp.]